MIIRDYSHNLPIKTNKTIGKTNTAQIRFFTEEQCDFRRNHSTIDTFKTAS